MLRIIEKLPFPYSLACYHALLTAQVIRKKNKRVFCFHHPDPLIQQRTSRTTHHVRAERDLQGRKLGEKITGVLAQSKKRKIFRYDGLRVIGPRAVAVIDVQSRMKIIEGIQLRLRR